MAKLCLGGDAVAFHRQRAAVFMPKPAAHRRNVHARFNASRSKENAGNRDGKLWQGEFLAGSLQTFARTFDRNNPVFRLRFFCAFNRVKIRTAFLTSDGAGAASVLVPAEKWCRVQS